MSRLLIAILVFVALPVLAAPKEPSTQLLFEVAHTQDNSDVKYLSKSVGVISKRDLGFLSALGVLVTKVDEEPASSRPIENTITHIFGAVPFKSSYAEFDILKASTEDRSAKTGALGMYYFTLPNPHFELGSGFRYSDYATTDDFALNEILSFYLNDDAVVYAGLNLSLRNSDFVVYRFGTRLAREAWKLDLSFSTGEGPIDVGVVDKFSGYSAKLARSFGKNSGYLAASRTEGDIYRDTQIVGGFQWSL